MTRKKKKKMNLFVLVTKIYTLACHYKQQRSFEFRFVTSQFILTGELLFVTMEKD